VRRIRLRQLLRATCDQTHPRRIGKPTTQKKIERRFRTYGLEDARLRLHREFIEYYKWERPHIALNYSTSAEVYFGDVPHVLG
jgi:transposase InsO family protein